MDIYQRISPWVIPKPDRRIPAAKQWLYRRFPIAQRAVRGGVWGLQEWMGLGNTIDQRLTRPLEAVARASIRRSIEDPELRARLTPDYAIGCKRLLLVNDWYPTLALDHVEVIGDRIRGATERGLVTEDGIERPAEVIVFGTGFHATEPLGELMVKAAVEYRWPSAGATAWPPTADDDRRLSQLLPDAGSEHRHRPHLAGVHDRAQIRHALAAMQRMRERGAAVIEPRAEPQAAYNATLQKRMGRQGGCSSCYLDAHGRNTTLWPGSSLSFARALRRIDDGEFHFEAPRRTYAEPTPTKETVA